MTRELYQQQQESEQMAPPASNDSRSTSQTQTQVQRTPQQIYPTEPSKPYLLLSFMIFIIVILACLGLVYLLASRKFSRLEKKSEKQLKHEITTSVHKNIKK